MARKALRRGAHPSFPLSYPALRSASLPPDFQYLKISLARELSASPGLSKPSFSAGELSAIGLMGKVCLAVIQRYYKSNPSSLSSLDDFFQQQLGLEMAQAALSEVLDHFPTTLTYDNPERKISYSYNNPNTTNARHEYYFSLLLILIAEFNSAIRSRDGLFTDPQLRGSSLFKDFLTSLQEFFAAQPSIFTDGTSLIDFLLIPGRLYPDSIYDQLLYIRNQWASFLDSDLLRSLFISLDHLKEEVIPGPPGLRANEDPLGDISGDYQPDVELVGYSPDQDWMPQVILQAKNIFVWLDQLSREYQRPITSLDQIPDEELVKLAKRGINALWLIGLWERSSASQKIKRICGNPEAISSAYALYDYVIAANLGGESAYQHFVKSAARFNIRLAADMVPNHVGVDSRWVAEHPDWFLSLDHSPFPGYSFEGVNLSTDPSMGIFLEDHYYDKTDAAVVFKRVDNHTGTTRYIYHGNDGTSMPWNDTAQLDFLNPAVREAVIQTVLHVARKFPIIRFDAAMTLSKKHYQRLWFPQPGTGGAIPTRSDFSLSKKEFDASMPIEFWRELVDRVAEEVPDTLLLAEAFWMMEGYFVRTLGMHRVYNSAFMHMLRDEDNVKFRDLIIKTLEFDPQILKRYVNFMNNPDEDTAISQFGSDGKYFGTCLLLSTLPGLPMFGHGQIEGFSEKYGMEYKRAYYDELPNYSLIERHQKEIFPLLHRRYLFSEVDHFVLYDLVTHEGSVNNDVYIYSNKSGNERALIVYHNKWDYTRGWVSRSTPVNGQSVTLLTGLDLSASDGDFLIFKDQTSGLDYIRSLNDLASRGLFLELGAYQYHAFIDFRVESDQDGILSTLEKSLNGSGCSSLYKRRLEIYLTPLIDLFPSLLSPWQNIPISFIDPGDTPIPSNIENNLHSFVSPWLSFGEVFSDLFPETEFDGEEALQAFRQRISSTLTLLTSPIAEVLSPEKALLIPWALLTDYSPLLQKDVFDILISEAFIATVEVFEELSNNDSGYLHEKLVFLLSLKPELSASYLDPNQLVEFWFSDPVICEFINLHEHEGLSWVHKESMESLIDFTIGLLFIALSKGLSSGSSFSSKQGKALTSLHSAAHNALNKSNFQVELFIKLFTSTVGIK